MKSLLFALLAGVVATATAASAASLTSNIEYGRVGADRLLLDARVPEGSGLFPVAILVHGGGWSSGDKSGSNHPGDGADVSPWFDLFGGAGYVCFSINYRMAPQHHWPACIDDVDTAIRWVTAHAAEYKGDPHCIVLVGHSAGGHLAMFAATQPEMAPYLRAVIGFAPVTDLVADSARRGGLSQSLQWLFGLPKEITPAARDTLWDASPLAHVHAGMPPVLIVHGDADRTVPYQQTLDFIAKLRTVNVPCELITRHGVPHSLVAGEKIDVSYKPTLLQWLQRTLASQASAKPEVRTSP